MKELKTSSVIFDPIKHQYFLNGKELRGITPILHHQLFPNLYKGVPDFVLKNAAEHGTMVHEQIELYDGGFEPKECSVELQSYKKIKKENNLTTIANEYIVTDCEFFASAIDLVFEKDNGDIILSDIKTTNTLYLDYVQFQLSIYAYLFELQNPDLKVSKLYALWLRGDNSEFAEVERIDMAIIKDLLQCEVEGRKFINPLAKVDKKMPTQIKDAELAVHTLISQIKELTEKKKQLSEGLLKLMQDNDIKTYKGEHITLSRKAASTRDDIDKAKLKKEYPEAYEACVKTTNISESLQIR